MKKGLKIAVVALVVLLAAALLVPLALRGRIGEIVKREANARLTARLDFERLDVSLLRHFPRATLEIKGLTLVGTGRFENDTLLAADRVSVAVNLASLFGDGGFEVSQVRVTRPWLGAHKTVDGAVNWEIVKPGQEPVTAENAGTDHTSPSAFRLALQDVRITDATLRYEDDSTRLRFSAAPVSLRLRGNLSADCSELALRLDARSMRLVSGAVTLLGGVDAELDARVEANVAAGRYVLSRNKLRLNAVELTLDGGIDISQEGAVAVDLAAGCEKVRFKDVLSLIPAFYTRDFRNLTAAGALSLSAWVRGDMRGNSLPAFEVKLDVEDGSFRYASLPKAVTGIHLTARMASPGGSADNTLLAVPSFGFTIAGNTVEASLRASNPVSDLKFEAAAEGRMDLGAVQEVYPLEKGMELAGVVTADLKAAGRLSDVRGQRYETLRASGTCVVEEVRLRASTLPPIVVRRAAASVTPAAITLGDLDATVGRSDFTANGQLTGYLGYLLEGKHLSGRLYVHSDRLDLNEWVTQAPASDAGKAAQKMPAKADTAQRTALVVPANLDLALSVGAEEILLGKMVLAGFTGRIGLREGTASLDQLAMQAFGGSVRASGSYSTAVDPARPALKLALDVRQASFERTFDELETVQRLVPLFRKTGGDYTLKLNLATALDASLTPDLATLDAEGEIRAAHIRIQNVEAFAKLADALRYDALRTVEARDVAIRFTVSEGRIATQPFDLRIGGATINLSGTTGLDQTIDYTARVSLPASMTGGWLPAMNVGIGGTFSAPRITLGAKDAVEETVTNLLKAGTEKLTGHATVEEALEAQKEKLEATVEARKEEINAGIERQVARLQAEAQRAGEKLVEAAEGQRIRLVEGAKNPLAKKAAEKAGDKLVEEARRQAERLAVEAEMQAAKLTAGSE